MKKIFSSILSLLLLLKLASCSSEDFITSFEEDAVFTLSVPRGMQTRGMFGDGTGASDHVTLNNLQYAVFEVAADGSLSASPVSTGTMDTFSGGLNVGSVALKLPTGKKYQVAFYADNSGNDFASFSNGKLIVDYSKGVSNEVAADAFIGRSTVFTVNGRYQESVSLSRPFSQLNWGTDDLEDTQIKSLLGDLKAAVSVTRGLYTSMNVITGKVEESSAVSSPVSFGDVAFKNLPTQDFPVDNYSLIAMNYLLTGQGTIDCKLEYSLASGGTSPNPVEVNNAPVKINSRTNIYGALLSAPADFKVDVSYGFVESLTPGNSEDPEKEDPDDKDPAQNLPKWDGSTLTEVTPVTETIDGTSWQVYSVSSGAELAWIAGRLNASSSADRLKSDNIYIRLTKDIDLNNQPFTQLCNLSFSNSSAAYKGIFDGDEHTIYNLNVENTTVVNSDTGITAGLIGTVDGGAVRNLTINGGTIKGAEVVGGIVGCLTNTSNKSTPSVSNCHVIGVAVILTLENSTSVKSNSWIGMVGGIVGRAQASESIVSGCSSNINIIIEDVGQYKVGAGGIVGGTITKKTLTISDCESKGTIQGTGQNVNRGGIIGYKESDSNVTISKCTDNVTIGE